MTWIQRIDPFGNIALSALVAAIPVLFIFLLLIRKVKGYIASLLTVALAIVIAMAVYGMPLSLALSSGLHGALYGLFPICWIIISAVFLFNVTVESGQFEIIKNFMASITPDRRLQALLIAFSFGAFLEGATGEIRLSILWEWVHKGATLNEDDAETGIKKGDIFTSKLFSRLLEEEYKKLLDAKNKDVHDDSKTTTLPISRAIAHTYVLDDVKAPWFIDLLNINLDNRDLGEAKKRIQSFMERFKKEGTRITENIDFQL